jgi:hypothetical protein
MTRRITAGAVASIAAIALTSVANAQAATPYRASLAPVDPAATTAGLATVMGQAQLVDGKKNNNINLHLRNLARRTTYLWHVHEGSCPVPGLPVAGWTYRTQDADGNGTVTANPAGNANTKATSATFDADPALSYSVAVQLATPTNGVPAGTVIACGDLTPNDAAGLAAPAGVQLAGGKGAHPEHAKGPKS